jgi:hypothetical protein
VHWCARLALSVGLVCDRGVLPCTKYALRFAVCVSMYVRVCVRKRAAQADAQVPTT